MIKEFKKFISRGNVIDLAVGIIIGGAFSKIVSSLVDNIIMPLVGLLLAGKDFSSLSFKIKDATISYGIFLQNVVDFFIIALCIFLIIKTINKLNERVEDLTKKATKFNKNKNEKEEIKEEVKKSDDTLLLEEIRDLLKNKNEKK